MSNDNPYDWAAQAGKDARDKQSARKAQKASEESEKVLQKRIADQEGAIFKKKSQAFLMTLSNQVQFAVNAFNQAASENQQVGAPLLDGESLGFVIPLRSIQTTVEIFPGNRKLTVFHTHRVGRDDRGTRLARAKNCNEDHYSIDLDAESRIVVTRHGDVVSENELVVQICTPLFEYLGASA
jgi:hypothetical protein